ncbi:hypothetical protein JRQ81_000741 [Phrynocephalus forsythii]|uniref:Myb/SANT-like DNA-binding domain-containing protein n=1 Tax=Phrynocephalus forsythii TaxID=171643 RepID=A0A9Q1B8A3_9SAUR|nr:hypothetical protein JRQ81_000741 [Phrynocephalus forsythii]
MVQRVGHLWSAHEIRSFLESLIQNYGPVLFVAGALRNEHAFVHAAEDLRLLGYNRSSMQCRSKFKILRQQFNLAILNFGEDPPREHLSPFWREMHKLWLQAAQPNPVNAFPPAIVPGMDAMMLEVRRQEVQNIIAIIQDLAQRVAAIGERLDIIVAQLNRPRRRRR